MSHILLIRSEPSVPPNLREVFSAAENRIVIRQSPTDVKTAVERDAFNIAVICADHGETAMRRDLRELRELSKSLFTIVLSNKYCPDEEAAAFEQGADLYFAEPVPAKSLRRLLQHQQGGTRQTDAPPHEPHSPATGPTAPDSGQDSKSTLHTLRDLSHILSYSLDYKAFTQHFILKLRDHISFSRIAIFVESSAKQALVKGNPSNHLMCIGSIGLPADLIDCFQLSRDVGIGREISQHPRVLHKNSDATHTDRGGTIEKEFSILGCHIAVPISDREGPIGVAVLNGPVTGRTYTNDELELLYLLMEELGLAIHNSRLHSELAQHGQLIDNVLHSMSSGALVCSEDLKVLYVNEAAKRFLRKDTEQSDKDIEFAELPASIAGAAHRTVEKGERIEPFQITGPGKQSVYRVSILPFSKRDELALLPQPIMIIMEDYTHIEANKRIAVDDTRTELMRLIAERFAHEIRNSLVPLSTHAQLIDQKIEKPEFQKSLKSALLRETSRIKRFSEQMLYIAQTSEHGETDIPLIDTIKNGFTMACRHCGVKDIELDFTLVCRFHDSKTNPAIEDMEKDLVCKGNEEALTYAFEELFINAIQARPETQSIRISIDANNEGIVRILIRDEGPGLTEDVLAKAAEPFFTTRNTGIGLGLSVAKKIISEQNGFLRLNQRTQEQDWDIEIELPLLITTNT